jgi:hypothetical protein
MIAGIPTGFMQPVDDINSYYRCNDTYEVQTPFL